MKDHVVELAERGKALAPEDHLELLDIGELAADRDLRFVERDLLVDLGDDGFVAVGNFDLRCRY